MLVLRIVDSPAQKAIGAIYALRRGLVIGRQADVDIAIADPHMSGQHAQVEEREGSLWLVDMDSHNGIFLKDNTDKVQSHQKQTQISLKLGQVFYLGRTLLQVQDDSGERDPHRLRVGSGLEKLLQKVQDDQKTRKTFVYPLELRILKGPQINKRWILGYGPREIGCQSADVPIREKAGAFLLIPHKNTGVKFETETPTQVLLNGHHVYSQEIQNGDVVEIGGTQIQILFLKEGQDKMTDFK